MIDKNKISSTLKQKKIEPQLRTEIHHYPLELDSPDAQLITIKFNYRYYDEPTVIQGAGSVSYQDSTGKYKTGIITTVQEYLLEPDSKLFIGAKVFVRARHLPNKLTYPIYGQVDFVVMGQGTSQYLGELTDAIPFVPTNGTIDDTDKDIENDPPPAITNLQLTSGTYKPTNNGKGQPSLAYIKATWTPVVHNDLQGYESDISEDDNTHYDEKPAPKFNSANMMVWMGLETGKTYYVRVRAVDMAGNTSDWVEGSITTAEDDTINPPTNVTATEQPPRGIVVKWTASDSANVFSYDIKRAESNDFSQAVKVGETQGTVYFDDNLDVSKTYYYWVSAVSTSGRNSTWVQANNGTGTQPHKLVDTDIQANSLYDSLQEIGSDKIKAGAITAGKLDTGALLTYNGTFVNRLKSNEINTYTVHPSATNGQQYLQIGTGTIKVVSYLNGSFSTVTLYTASGGISCNTSSPYVYVYVLPTVDSNGNPVANDYNYPLPLYSSTEYPTSQYAIVLFTLYTYYSSNLGQYTIDVQKIGNTGTIINGDHIQTGSIVAENIKAGSITADKLSVSQLSAISANIGTVTAGTLIGTTIKTASSGKMITLDDTNELKFYDTNGYLAADMYAGSAGAYLTLYYQGATSAQIYNIDGNNTYIVGIGNIYLNAGGQVVFQHNNDNKLIVSSDGSLQIVYGKIYFQSTHYLYNNGDSLIWHKSDGSEVTIA